ncbi:MAG: hypothetical protein BMS9Abin08_1358 [Gammaproteobacteria bacterium]|nr:MAG: hypothetical protein BMS9Abin08_1358 [Gammaproteobacteria bacterium]
MPGFHVEEKITLGTWDDTLNRPGYQSPVEPHKFRFRRIAAVYSFQEPSARCGVSDCQQAHSQGFLVITSDEKETSLCEACGQRLLGVTFNSQGKALQDLARIGKQQLRLNKVLEQSDVIKTRVKELKQAPKGANWLYQAQTSFRKAAPADLLATLKTLATSETGAEESQLQGLGIFAADIREELISKILKPLK